MRPTDAPARRAPEAGTGSADDGSLRLFFALAPDAATRAALAALARDVAGAMGGRAPRDENLHLTLAFLGQQPSGRVAALAAIGAAAATAAPPFVLTLDRVGAFRSAGIGWAGTDRVPPALQAVVAALAAGLAAAGLPVERRPFHPHVTLVRRGTRAPEGIAPAPLDWHVERLVLMASDTLPEGPRYREIGGWPLAASAAGASPGRA
jgi:RNA 2',3'-cyclic 3'-phosphodiesterase